MHVLIAPNAFKHAVSAHLAATSIQDGLMSTFPECSVTCFPIGDGGDGTATLIMEQCGGVYVDLW